MPGSIRHPLRLRQALGIGRISRPRLAAEDDASAAAFSRVPARLGRALVGLLIASIAVPLLLLAVAALQNYRLVHKEAEERVANTAGEMREQALKVFETYALVLDWVDDRAKELGRDQIAQDPDFHQFLADLDDLPQIAAVRVIDAGGTVRASGGLFPVTSADVSDRDYFIAQKAARIGLYIGRDHISRVTHVPEFDISRRRSTPDGSFGGIVTVSARPSYFRDFYRTISHQPGFAAMLVRSDGAILVLSAPSSHASALAHDGPLMRALASGRDSGVIRGKSVVDRIDRIYGYRRVPGYPLYVVFGIPTAGVLAAWRANLISFSLFAVPASIGLFLLTLFALRQLQRYEILSWRWRTTARRLRREMRGRELVEDELRQSHKMEALGQLTGGVAHDFNNLLAVLQVALEMLRGRQADERLETKVDLALATVARGEKLTSQLLAFARRHPLAVESVDINAHLCGMTELLTRTVGGEITIEIDLAPDLAPAHVDANQFELAVINLAINARDAMPEGGLLRIRTYGDARRLALPEELAKAGEDLVVLEISDTGCGMSPEVLAHAFEPFFTTKEPGKGTGLGLSTVYGFARQSGGTAMIRSEVGRGTTVILVLPKSRAADGAGDLPAGGPA
ncbi:MAG TPA: ATP-binding protein [Stellaceae bacterium]|nr:ATP-binding protein [Stellaceae bacterium]